MRVIRRDLFAHFAISRNLNEGASLKIRRAFWAVVYLFHAVLLSVRAMAREQLGSRVRYRGKVYFISNWSGGPAPTIAREGEYLQHVPREELKNIISPGELLHRFSASFSWWMSSWHQIHVHRRLGYLAVILAALGCTTATAQTNYDQQQDARIRALEERVFGTTTGGTTTGGTTTGGTTTGGSTTGGTTTGGSATGGVPNDRILVWSTTHETGNISTWNFGRRAIYDSGNGRTSLVEMPGGNAKSGRFALRQTVNADDSSGARCFITGDAQNRPIPKQLYMTAWIYIPSNSFNWQRLGSWWNHVQLKERPSIGGEPVDPTLHLSLARDSNGIYQRIYNWIPGQKYYINQSTNQPRTYLPFNKWTKIEWYVDSRVSGGSTWLKQDDKLIIERNNIKTLSNDNYVLNFSVNCYGGSGPGQVTYYWDDVTLETNR